MQKKVLGLDIREKSVIAVLVSKTGSGCILEKATAVSISSLIESGRFTPDAGKDEIEALLEEIAAQIDVKSAECRISIPVDSFIFRNISMPFKNRGKISRVLPFELQPSVFKPIDGLAMEFRVLDRGTQGDSPYPVMVLCLDRALLGRYRKLFERLGISPVMITTGELCRAEITRAAAGMHSRNRITAGISEGRLSIVLTAENTPSVIRVVTLPENMEAPGSEIIRHIKWTAAAGSSILGKELRFEEIVISGPGFGERFESEISGAMQVPVKRLDLLSKADLITGAHAVPERNRGEYDTAAALALSGFHKTSAVNFSEKKLAVKKFITENKNHILPTAMLAFLFLIMLSVHLIVVSDPSKAKAEDLDREINAIFRSAFPDVSRIVDPVQQMRIKIDALKKQAVFADDTRNTIKTIDILGDISRNIPEEIKTDLTRLVISEGSILITGLTDTYNSVDDIVSRFEKIPYMDTVKISSATTDKSTGKIRFKIKAGITGR